MWTRKTGSFGPHMRSVRRVATGTRAERRRPVMRVPIAQIKEKKLKGEKIPMLTAYDYGTARILDEAGVPMILVGDSLGMVVLGYEPTIPVPVGEILRHT